MPTLTRKGQATRDRIVTAAATLMFERGATGTTIEDVQQAAGVSASQLYHYFADKRDLVRAVITHQTALVLSVHEPWLERLDSLDALHRWADMIVTMQRRRQGEGGCPIGSLASELADIDETARCDLVGSFAQWETAIGDGLRAMHVAGVLRPEADPQRLALVLLTALQGGLLLAQLRRDVTALEAGLDAAVAHVEGFAA